MTQKSLKALSAALGLAILSGGLAGCMSTATYGTGEHPEVAMLREITGGLGAPKKEPIEYQPRAPLVVPPSGQLRAPVDGAQVASADWPVDPEGAPRASRYDDDTITPEKRRELQALYQQLPQQERQRSRRIGTDRNTVYDAMNDREADEQFSAALAKSKNSNCSERRYLTQPPTEYCDPADTAPQTFENIDGDGKRSIFGRIFGRS